MSGDEDVMGGGTESPADGAPATHGEPIHAERGGDDKPAVTVNISKRALKAGGIGLMALVLSCCCFTGLYSAFSGGEEVEFACVLQGNAAALVVCEFQNKTNEPQPSVGVISHFNCDNVEGFEEFSTLRTIWSGRLPPRGMARRAQRSPNFQRIALASGMRGPGGWSDHCRFTVERHEGE